MTHTRIINVMECGAAGDGGALDTAAINRAIETCASKGGAEPPFVDVRPLPAWGFYARNVQGLRLGSVRLIRNAFQHSASSR